MNIKRRIMLKGTLAGSAIAVAAGAGLIAPRAVLAAWPKEAFAAKSVEEAMNAAFGSKESTDSDQISFEHAPDIAENGAVVPITIKSAIPRTESISILVAENGTPLTAKHTLGEGAEAYVSTRIKMGKTSDVIALVQANGKLYSRRKNIKVTIGGCGG